MKLKLSLLIAAAAGTNTLFACTGYYVPSYLKDNPDYQISLNKNAAFKYFVKMHRDLLPAPAKFQIGTSTKEAEKLDFTAAVKLYCPGLPEAKRAELIEAYCNFVFSWRNSADISVDKFPELPPELDEFKLYISGYSELLGNPKLADTPDAWKKLLALPAERRKFRTAWVHFMLGNHFKKDCHTHYDNCRNAVRSGFADTPGLALRSYTLEIRYGKNIARVIRRAAEAESIGSPLSFLENISPKMLDDLSPAEYFNIIEDPLTREFLALIDPSPIFEKMSAGYKLRNADILACHFYNFGAMDKARKYIAQLEKPTLLSLYLEAKIARHKGNTFLAVKKLRQWLDMAKAAAPVEPESLISLTLEGGKNKAVASDVYGLMGNALVMRHNFREAAEFFYRADSTPDLYRIMESYFTLAEAVKFVEDLPDSPVKKSLSYMTARRAFRENAFDTAKKYMPEDLKKYVSEYVKFTTDSNDLQSPPDTRAIALYNAAKILRIKGMEISGTELEPDYFPGYFGSNNPALHCALSKAKEKCRFNRTLCEWTLCEKHLKQQKFYQEKITFSGLNTPHDHNQVPKHQRYHYRYKAARLALKAASIAQDDDLRALIFIFGGSCVHLQSPLEADIFYKDLVNCCKKSKLSKLADKLRWFPLKDKRIKKEVESVDPLKDLAAVKKLIAEMFPQQ